MKKRAAFVAGVLALVGALSAAAQETRGDPIRGRATYLRLACDACHGTAGQGTRFGVRLAPEPLPAEVFTHQMRHPRSAMPRYSQQFVSDADIADIMAYLAAVKRDPKADEIPLLKE